MSVINKIDKILISKGITLEHFFDLFTSSKHTPYLGRHRASLIITRVRLISVAFSVLTFVWIAVDILAFPQEIWVKLAIMRLLSTVLFVALAWPWKVGKSLFTAYFMLALMLVNPLVFYLFSLMLFTGVEVQGMASIVSTLYTWLPFIIIAGLSVFPLTVIEGVLYALPVIAFTVIGPVLAQTFDLAVFLPKGWVLILVLGVYLMAGMIQLHYMMVLVNRVSQDVLTKAFTRRSGAELIDLYFHISQQHGTPFALAFFDLDHFKLINDDHGHDEGDRALVMTVEALHQLLRKGDMVVRWGGEEFVVILTNTDIQGIRLVMRRILDTWLGERPGGGPLTASIGIAERCTDDIENWGKLVELADSRMYEAKKSGRARCVLCNGEVMS